MRRTSRGGTKRSRVLEPAHDTGAMMLDLHDVWAYYAGRCALEGVSMHLAAGERIAVVGPNGAGKSTLFKVIAGILKPSAGTVQVSGSSSDRHVCVAYIEQHANINARFPRHRRGCGGDGPCRPGTLFPLPGAP